MRACSPRAELRQFSGVGASPAGEWLSMIFPLISTRIHGCIDYAVGAFLFAAPYLFGFATGGAKQWVTMALGAFAIGYSLLTRYELGAVPVLSMRGHLAFDVAFALLLGASPWVFAFASEVYAPHIAVALAGCA